ncbi:hypothetical protein CRE_20909 [Caenorhabditis remanei]|uniref:Uncharacterized protein n=1 Tax=Caenorhabditis remanei TaxID=31234 RepID=E3N3R3_CAERE|nr:hypothetical protein CRE_20909 [Caenorhabditis remanei]
MTKTNESNIPVDENAPPQVDSDVEEEKKTPESSDTAANSPAVNHSKNGKGKVPPSTVHQKQRPRKSINSEDNLSEGSNEAGKLQKHVPAVVTSNPEDVIILDAIVGPKDKQDDKESKDIKSIKTTVEAIMKVLSSPPDCSQSCKLLSRDMRQMSKLLNDLIVSNNSVVNVLHDLANRKDTNEAREQQLLDNSKRNTDTIEEVRKMISTYGTSIGRVEGMLTREYLPAVLQPVPPVQGKQDNPSKGPSLNVSYRESLERYPKTDNFQKGCMLCDQQINLCMKCLEIIPAADGGHHRDCPNENTECRNCRDIVNDPAASNHHTTFCGLKMQAKEKVPAAQQPSRPHKRPAQKHNQAGPEKFPRFF